MSDLDAQHRGSDDGPSPPAGSGGDTGSLPRIADYWPDAPQRMGPEADYRVDDVHRSDAGHRPDADEKRPTLRAEGPDGPATRLISPPPRPRRSWLRVFLAILGALVFLGGSV